MKFTIIENNLDKLGRRYSNAELEKTLKNKEFLGEVAISDLMPGNINLVNTSHRITDITVENGNVYGNLTVLDTPRGLIAKYMLSEGVIFRASIRGSGTIDKNKVVSDLQVHAIDLIPVGEY